MHDRARSSPVRASCTEAVPVKTTHGRGIPHGKPVHRRPPAGSMTRQLRVNNVGRRAVPATQWDGACVTQDAHVDRFVTSWLRASGFTVARPSRASPSRIPPTRS